MDSSQYFVVLKGVVSTQEVTSVAQEENRIYVTFTNGDIYPYNPSNVKYLTNPTQLNPADYRLITASTTLYNVAQCTVFKEDNGAVYAYVVFSNGTYKSYLPGELRIIPSVLCHSQARTVLDYLRQMASYSDLKDDDGVALLLRQYNRLTYVHPESVLACYLQPKDHPPKTTPGQTAPIFPFGCNASQHKGVVSALENQLSVIQGPPGTGKTQTILNIIANLLIQGKTIQIVSNSNSATLNVLEKLSAHGLDFLVASLGRNQNKTLFLKGQTDHYPDMTAWLQAQDAATRLETLQEEASHLSALFASQTQLAQLKLELQELRLEYQHFLQQKQEVPPVSKTPPSGAVMAYWQGLADCYLHEKPPSVWRKLWGWFRYGLRHFSDSQQVLLTIKNLYYLRKQAELTQEIEALHQHLQQQQLIPLHNAFTAHSMEHLKDHLYHRYGTKAARPQITLEDLWRNSTALLQDYPIVLSTTFSAASNLDKNTLFDYVIMDEASQIDVSTAALALSSAKNAVIVGDLHQLPHVVPAQLQGEFQTIFQSYQLDTAYAFTNSFLASTCNLFPTLPCTLLREHYRCHPAIIQFCNQKFYNNQLLIMTEDQGEEDALILYQTVPGNHNRDHINQRQIDVILQEVLPTISIDAQDVGLIAPYNNQVDALIETQIPSDTATVHKFQGREKDTIILSTVDEHWQAFSDQPTLINVAVSRAKRHLIVVGSGNELPPGSNLSDLMGYIRYRNLQVIQSNVTSVFDYLYAQYTKERMAFLASHHRISEHDSETLMYHLICDVLKAYPGLSTAIHVPLHGIVGEDATLSQEEYAFAHHPYAHLDFLIYNTLTKEPVLAVEVDGFTFHNTPEQKRRDGLKNHILDAIHLPLLRCPTNGSGEQARLTAALADVYRVG